MEVTLTIFQAIVLKESCQRLPLNHVDLIADTDGGACRPGKGVLSENRLIYHLVSLSNIFPNKDYEPAHFACAKQSVDGIGKKESGEVLTRELLIDPAISGKQAIYLTLGCDHTTRLEVDV